MRPRFASVDGAGKGQIALRAFELVGAAGLYQAPGFHHQYQIHLVDPVQAVGGENNQPVAKQRQQGLFEFHLGFDIQMRGGFVQNENASRGV